MRTPQVPAMPGMTALGLRPIATDQKTVAERKWREGFKPSYPQKPCDHGLFSDDAAQLDLVEMLMEPTNQE